VCVCVCVCVYIYIYIHTHTHTHTHTLFQRNFKACSQQPTHDTSVMSYSINLSHVSMFQHAVRM